MKVVKVAEFTEEEVAALKKAGEILGATARAIAASEIDALDEEATQLVLALKDVMERV